MPEASRPVLITGASTGIGLKTAVLLAEHGFQVFASMRDPGRRGPLEQEAERRRVQVSVLRLDVTDRASIGSAVASVAREAGGIYGLINNAGIETVGFFEDLTDAEVREAFETNVFGTLAVTRAVLPYMRAAGAGRIITLSSVAGKLGCLGSSAYCTSRFAQEGFFESLAQEVRPLGIQVTLVEPGIVKSDHWTSANRRLGRGVRNPQSPYYRWFLQFEKLVARLVENAAIRPEHVAGTILRAITAPQPRLRYAIGRKAAWVIAGKRYLPEAWFERIYFDSVIRRVTEVEQ
jgi:NAD(P)-dependent dehydrogenase (short-subunit alcohol dehydrogenase family)